MSLNCRMDPVGLVAFMFSGHPLEKEQDPNDIITAGCNPILFMQRPSKSGTKRRHEWGG